MHARLQCMLNCLQPVNRYLVLKASIVYSQIRAINGGEKINRGEKLRYKIRFFNLRREFLESENCWEFFFYIFLKKIIFLGGGVKKMELWNSHNSTWFATIEPWLPSVKINHLKENLHQIIRTLIKEPFNLSYWKFRVWFRFISFRPLPLC